MPSLIEKDKQYIWHPYTHLIDDTENIVIEKAEGVYLYASNGNKYIDAASSWWTNIHGHAHPFIAKKIADQAQTLEHVIFGGFTHKPAIDLAEQLLLILPENQKKIFFSDNGSTSVEVALKMTLQYWHNQNNKKSKIIALKGAYHGDTFGAMSVSTRNVFTNAFEQLLFEVLYTDLPLDDNTLQNFETIIKKEKDSIACFIFEPIVQGVAGMQIYNSQILDRMIAVCRANNIFCIADEVMTGFGRTGKMFASDYLKNKPDIICLSKGITGGFLPLGITSCTQEIYNAFISSDQTKTFFHGHSYTGNPISCAAALASLSLFKSENVFEKIAMIEQLHISFVKSNRDKFSQHHFRTIGTILAIEIGVGDTHYLNSLSKTAYEYFLRKNILMRPLGNIIYVVPPYCISVENLDYIYSSIVEFLNTINNDI